MLFSVKVLSSSVDSMKRRVVKYLRLGSDDVQTSVQAGPFGVDSNAPKDMVAIYGATSEKGKTVIIGYINKNALAEVGGYRMFSTDESGEVKSVVYLRNNGDIEINGTDDNLVRYAKLKEGFDKLKSDFNSLVTAYNSHIHITTATVGPGPTPGVIAPTTSTGTASSAEITGSKCDTLKTGA
jgi:hypothetical protein